MEVDMTNKKVDICYANAIKKVRGSLKLAIALHFIQCLTMGTMVVLEANHNIRNDEVLSFFITAGIVSFVNFLSKLGHLKCYLEDTPTCLYVATMLNHVVEEEPNSQRLSGGLILNEKDLISQTIYNAQTSQTVGEVPPQMQNMMEASLTNMIKTLTLSRNPFNRCVTTVASGISFGLFIYGIIIMATNSITPAQTAVMVIFLISEFIIQFQIFLCLIFVALLPVLCVFCCFYVACCSERERPAKLPEPTPATIETIQKSDGAPCSICFQDILLEEQVIVLPCSQKHVFHENCIKAWANVKPTCPICRFDLSA